MARLIPNENTYLGFALEVADLAAPTAAEIASAVDLTSYMVSVNASSSGNTVPTPSLDTLFETSIPGTIQGAFSADFYRDDEDDLAWETLPRKATGFMILSRFDGVPQSGDAVEVWPIMVVSRTNSNTGSNTVLTFTATCSVYREPEENAVVAA